MRRLPPLTALEAFAQVARLGSVKAAAEELALSTPALSRRVQALERFVGKTLFDRKHQAMELNADGQRLLDNIAPALDVLTMAVEEVQKDSNKLRLRLSVLPQIGRAASRERVCQYGKNSDVAVSFKNKR